MAEPWINTYTGRRVNPLNLQAADICIEDIAHALANINRFVGHAKFPLSVAQHSYYVSRLCEGTPHALQALLHDASEAFLGDVTKWLKECETMVAYREAEARAQKTIYAAFGCALDDAPEIKTADIKMVRLESYEGFGDQWNPGPTSYPTMTPAEREAFPLYWSRWHWKTAEDAFLRLFQEVA